MLNGLLVLMVQNRQNQINLSGRHVVLTFTDNVVQARKGHIDLNKTGYYHLYYTYLNIKIYHELLTY